PRVLCCRAVDSPFGRPAIVMERIHGSALEWTYWMPAADRPPERRHLLFRLMAQLHSIDTADILPDDALFHSNSPHECIDEEIESLENLSDRHADLPPSLGRTLEWLKIARERIPCERA